MPVDHAVLPARWPLKVVTLPSDAKPGQLSAVNKAPANAEDISPDKSTAHVAAVQDQAIVEGWRFAFVSAEDPAKFMANLESALKHDNWRIAPTDDPSKFKAYLSPDGVSLLGVTRTPHASGTTYEIHLVQSNPPGLLKPYRGAKPIP